MTFTYDPDLGDELSRSRALLLDTDAALPLFSDEAYRNYFDLFGVDAGTAQLATILLNKYGNMPTAANITGLGNASWGDRLDAWKSVVLAATEGAVSGVPGGEAAAGEPAYNQPYRMEVRTKNDP